MREFHPHAQLDIERLDALMRRALVFNHIGDAMIVAGPDGTIKDWNDAAEEMLGWSRTEALGQTPAIFHRPEDAPTLWPTIQTAVIRAGRWSGRVDFLRKDGREGCCTAVALPLLDHERNVWGTLLAQTEIASAPPAAKPGPPEVRLAHDLNNLLTGVLGNASLVRLDLPPESALLPLIRQIESAAERAAGLCHRTLSEAAPALAAAGDPG